MPRDKTHSQGNNNLNFRLARDQVVHLETAANLCASPRQEKILFCSHGTIFELGGITKHLMTGPKENSEFCFPEALSVPVGPSLSFSQCINPSVKHLIYTILKYGVYSRNWPLRVVIITLFYPDTWPVL